MSALVTRLLGAYLETLQQVLVVARAYQVEIDALGPPARERRREALTLSAICIRHRLAQTADAGQSPAELPWTAYIGVVYAALPAARDASGGPFAPRRFTLRPSPRAASTSQVASFGRRRILARDTHPISCVKPRERMARGCNGDLKSALIARFCEQVAKTLQLAWSGLANRESRP